MYDDVAERFSVVLGLVSQQRERQESAVGVVLSKAIRIEDVLPELKPMMLMYADINTRKACEVYNAYLVAKTIHDNVENASNGHATPEIKKAKIKAMYAMLAGK